MGNTRPLISSFTKIVIFVFFGTIGLTLINLIPIRLKPSQHQHKITIEFKWTDVNPRIIESVVTNKIEASVSVVPNILNVNSISSKGEGVVNITFDDNIDIERTRLQISSIIRQVYPSLPSNVSYPKIVNQEQNDESSTLLSLSLNGEKEIEEIERISSRIIKPIFSKVKGVSQVDIIGIPKYKYVIQCDRQKIKNLKVDLNSIKKAISNSFYDEDIGFIKSNNKKLSLNLNSELKEDNIEVLLETVIITEEKGIIKLKDIAIIDRLIQEQEGFKRFNGYNALTINIDTNTNENQLDVVSRLNMTISDLNDNLKSDGLTLNVLYDSTIKLKKELYKVIYRVLFSVVLLFVFIFIVSRNFKYVLVLFLSLVVNLLIAILFYYLFNVNLHLYSFAGLTISLGLIIDNAIIMIDHSLNHRNRKVFVPILAATLTTIGSLVVVFFLDKSYQLYLIDFCFIIIINLSVSLFTSLFLIPSLSEKLKLLKNNKAKTFRKRRLVLKFNKVYFNTLFFLIKRKKIVFLVLLLSFGLPFFLIPNEINAKSDFEKKINDIINSEFYKSNIKPTFKYLGGSMYHFFKSTEKGFVFSEPERLALKIKLHNPEGGTISQLNKAVKIFENDLKKYEEVQMFQAEVIDKNNALISIFFNDNYEDGNFPYSLKNRMEAIATQIGGVDSSIFGVGQGFSNSGSLISDASIKVKGYNLDKLLFLSDSIKDNILLINPRINKVTIASEKSWILKEKYEYKLELSNNKYSEITQDKLLKDLEWYSGTEIYLSTINKAPIFLSSSRELKNHWELKNEIITSDSTGLKLGDVSRISKSNVVNKVVKKNGEYEVFLDYSFSGSNELNRITHKELIKIINTQLPIGYKSTHPDDEYNLGSNNSIIWKSSLIIMLIIYFICAILFESLLQPLTVILTIPISFIGVFLTFSLFDLVFDQGGLASFIMLSGIVVNSTIYIINQYNNERKSNRSNLLAYIRAYNSKITPIILTILSTILGLIPFVVIEGNDFFWTSFAYGNIGGLLFSVLVILFVLPLCLKINYKS